ncbi:DUF3048 domain-containing protein [Saccharopolyspora rosea]|uniref:DUF3048 domain-containing protein n=1 Tax=Saccharopolyspora rosea TaxID=524884 RepID=A0ABW3FWW9_9PSEU
MWRSRVLGILVGLVAVLAVGLGLQGTATRSIPVPHAPVPRPVVAPAPPPAPPVLAVKVDNAPAARPPTGIAAADVVFVEPVEAGITRIIAVFAAHLPPVVGPVRSARQTDLRLLPEFGHPTLAYSGAAPELLPAIARAPVNNASEATLPAAFFRGPGQAPHNLFVRPSRLPAGAPWSPAAPLVFGQPPAGGAPDTAAEVRYSAARVGFDWDAAQQRYLVSMDGSPYATSDGERLGASTVVLQRVPVSAGSYVEDVAGNVSPYADTVGSGEALVLRDGLAHQARWSRPSPEAGTTYTTSSGQPLPFAPGQVWIVLVPA